TQPTAPRVRRLTTARPGRLVTPAPATGVTIARDGAAAGAADAVGAGAIVASVRARAVVPSLPAPPKATSEPIPPHDRAPTGHAPPHDSAPPGLRRHHVSQYYLTTAIDYANGDPHIGHAYEKIGADVIARYRRLRGDRVHLLIGMDEHGQKVAQAASERGVSPQEFVDDV